MPTAALPNFPHSFLSFMLCNRPKCTHENENTPLNADEFDEDTILPNRVFDFLRRHQKKARLSKLFIKFALIAGGALIAGLSSFFLDTDAQVLAPSTWEKGQIWGMIGTLAVFLGALYMAFTEEDSGAVYDAQEAINKANALKVREADLYGHIEAFAEAAEQLRSLVVAYGSARGFLEQAASNRITDEVQIIRVCLDAMENDLLISAGFEMEDTWTICVYQRARRQDDETEYLELVAHSRKIKCNLRDARRWPIGVGVGGMALAKDAEVVAPDIIAPGAGNLFKLDGEFVRERDLERYRSMMAVPVNVDGDEKPWGIVLVSSDRADHFGAPPDKAHGVMVRPEQTVRTLASVIALCVAIARCSESA